MSFQTKVRGNYLNRTAKLLFFKHRQHNGDVAKLANITGYNKRMIYYVLSGERKINETIANAMYSLTRKRQKNEVFA